MPDPIFLAVWGVVSATAAFVLAGLLLLRHVFAAQLRGWPRRAIDLAIVPLYGVFVTYIVARHLV